MIENYKLKEIVDAKFIIFQNTFPEQGKREYFFLTL